MEQDYTVGFADLQDIPSWMELVEQVRDNFPGLDTQEQLEGYRQTVIKNIQRRTALCAKVGDQVVGVLIFSLNAGCLSCMAVHPLHRRRGIACQMMKQMLSLFPEDADIWVSTFREGDEKGVAPRRLYKKFGFVEDALGEEFGYPHQRFVLYRK